MQNILSKIRGAFQSETLPPAVIAEQEWERTVGASSQDPGADAVVSACAEWLFVAQDKSASADGGVARDYSLVKGWAVSYPETTGYIVPTIIDLAQRKQREDWHQRARRMLDWFVKIQFPEGGFQGGKIDASPCVPVTFNTGQILLGLAAGAKAYGDERYLTAMHRAAAWLRDDLDADGCWRKHPTPFAAPGEKAYETHVAWGLFEADRVAPDNGYGVAGLRQVNWALTKQQANGWLDSNCLTDPKSPLTHTIGYALRGIIEGHLLSGRPDLLEAARRTADGVLAAVEKDGRLFGRLDSQFRPAVDFVCLTGSVQIAHCMLLLWQLTNEQRYLDIGKRLNSYVRRTIHMDGPPEIRGGVKGSFPVGGAYGRFEFLNWAAKFCIDSNLIESDIDNGVAHA